MHLHLCLVHFKLNLKDNNSIPKCRMPIATIGVLIILKQTELDGNTELNYN